MTKARDLSQVPNASLGFKNRIINGAMMIDQRNAGASVSNTTSTVYSVDRWTISGSSNSRFTAQRSAIAPSGYTNSLLLTSSSAFSIGSSDYFYLMQGIEGFNVADLGWGTSSAQTVTLSFWIRSSLTGTFGGTIRNLISGANRGYPFTYTINSANTWEQKSITIAGDTSGTWATDNTCSLTVCFGLGAGSTFSGTAGAWTSGNLISATSSTSLVSTNGATFYITGVQLEKGSTATSFDYRPYGTELALCQRYFARLSSLSGNFVGFGSGVVASSTAGTVYVKYPVRMRASPTVSQSNTAVYDNSVQAVTSIGTVYYGDESLFANLNVASGLTATRGCIWCGNNSASAYVDLSSEL